MRNIWLASVAITPLFLTAAAAQDAFALDEIVVAGGLSPIAADALGRSATVLTAADIETRGLTRVQDALRTIPGVAVNGTETAAQVRIRGAEGNHTLVLIDGVEAAGGDGEYFFSGLDTANIERIEVLRGPQSVYYGSNASAGVINIITRKGATGDTFTATVEAGAAVTTSAFAARRTDRGGLSLALSRVDDQGFDQSGDGGEKDGSLRSEATLAGDYRITPDLQLGFTLRRAEQEFDVDPDNFTATDVASLVTDDPTMNASRDETTAALFAEYAMLDGRLTHRLSYAQTKYDYVFNDGPADLAEQETLKYRLSYALDGRAVADAAHLLNVLLEDQQDSSTSDARYNRQTRSVAAEYRGRLANGLDVQAGLRFDANEVFDDATTWNVGLSYPLGNAGTRLHASAGVGIVNPTYFELFADDFGFVGNPDLQPERNESFDLGVTFALLDGRGTLDLTYFNETLTDEIETFFDGTSSTYTNAAGESDRQGIEVAGTLAATDDLSLRMSYTYLDARNADGSIEVRRPRNALTLGATLATFDGRGSVSADVQHVTGNFDTQFFGNFEVAELPAYTTADVAARIDLTDRVALNARVTNLFDAEASEVWGYAARGRSAYMGVSAQF